MNDIGYCNTCVEPQCDQPRIKKTMASCPKGLAWTNGTVHDEISEHWDCPNCEEILFIETADQHRCEVVNDD